MTRRPLRQATRFEAGWVCPRCLATEVAPAPLGTVSTVPLALAETRLGRIGHVMSGTVRAIGWRCPTHERRVIPSFPSLADHLEGWSSGVLAPVVETSAGTQCNAAVPYREAGLAQPNHRGCA